jgi:hypothetical protein
MQSTSELLTALSEKGITISLAGGKLKAEPRHLVTEEVKALVVQHKAEIIEALSIRQRDHGDPGRTWAPGNPFTCECGLATGWLRDGKPLCPVCDGKAPAGAGAITTEADHITRVKTAPGVCPLCGVPFDQDGGDCWHRSFHIGTEESTGAPPCDDKHTPYPTACGKVVRQTARPMPQRKLNQGT